MTHDVILHQGETFVLWLSLNNITYLGFKVDITKAITSLILYDNFYAEGNKRFSIHFRFCFWYDKELLLGISRCI